MSYLKFCKNVIISASIKATDAPPEKPLVGGDWELINQDGKTVTNKDFLGNWCIVYFGFTHCPDICPDELEKIVEVMSILGNTMFKSLSDGIIFHLVP